MGVNRVELLLSILLIGAVLFREKYLPGHTISSNKRFYLYTTAMVTACYFFGVFIENQFIYFQF